MSSAADDGLIESVKKTLMDRINTPLFGFIFLSWIVFNWDNILFVMLSDASIEKRINAIKISGDFLFKGFLCPVSSGFLLSVAFPYLQWLVSFLQRFAQKLIDNNKKQRESDECAAIIALAKDRANADSAVESERTRTALEIAEKKRSIASVEFNTEQMQKQYQELHENIEKGKGELAKIEDKQMQIDVNIRVSSESLQALKKQEEELKESFGSFNEIRDDVIKFTDRINSAIEKINNDMTEKKTVADNYREDGNFTQVTEGTLLLDFIRVVHSELYEVEKEVSNVRSKLKADFMF
ncbi:hypothetical protein QO199_23210 [Serratia bockelmannii]|uniref:Uncharacterized protein n=1 Tax=Serratia bockelmannii TaxID=2703793 RepID=A0ABT8LW73_9GAMM|nr:hypothetical protein [Serratia bockelmannii]MDN6881553.1 hypothetical protein [Serratia bockelmannii]HBH6886400.1 hypothetical protein [Serratia marcescens]HEO9032537.1 hypothetical protein [Serratia marcescens]